MTEPVDIRFVVFDVDGVLTDGRILLDARGTETKRFHVRDGLAIRAAMSMGIKIGVLTARSSPAVALRMNELNVKLLIQGAKDKKIGFQTLCQQAEVEMNQTAYMGDDLLDLPALLRCGYPMAPADAVAEVLKVARYITAASGGQAAAREAIEHILKAQGHWDKCVEQFGN